jgi:hypothetical protein
MVFSAQRIAIISLWQTWRKSRFQQPSPVGTDDLAALAS